MTVEMSTLTINGITFEIVDAEARKDIVNIKASAVQIHPNYPEVNDTVENALAWLEENGDTTKVYVLPDGYIYGYMTTEKATGGYTNLAEPLPDNTTDTTKWVNGYRFGSSGAPSAQSGTTVSNMVACKGGDVIRIKGVTLRENIDRVAIHLGGNDETNYSRGYFNVGVTFGNDSPVIYNGLEDGVYTFTLSNWGSNVIDGFRFAMPTPEDASKVIITVNEEIVEAETVKDYGWANTGLAFVPADYEDRIIALEDAKSEMQDDITEIEGNISNLTERINDVESGKPTALPDYWEVYLTDKIAAIKALQKTGGKDCFSFVLMADTHYPANLGKNSPILAKKIMDECSIKFALHAGDWQTRGCHNTKDSLLAENEAIEAWLAPIRDRLLMEQGNHDGTYGLLDRDGDGTHNNSGKEPQERESYVHNLTPEELHEFVYRKVGMVGNVHFDETGTAYYIDDTSNKVRYIGLNTQCNNYELQADGTQKYPKMWLMRFTQPQFDFLIDEALVEGVTDKTKIVIFAHVPTTQELGDKDVMNGVLKAFANKSTYSGSYAGEYGYDAVSVNADFSNAKGSLIGYFHGHTHVDSVNTANGFNIIGTRCDAAEENDATLKSEKVAGTITEQSFDVFTVNTKTRTIHATKIGAGDDRVINY